MKRSLQSVNQAIDACRDWIVILHDTKNTYYTIIPIFVKPKCLYITQIFCVANSPRRDCGLIDQNRNEPCSIGRSFSQLIDGYRQFLIHIALIALVGLLREARYKKLSATDCILYGFSPACARLYIVPVQPYYYAPTF